MKQIILQERDIVTNKQNQEIWKLYAEKGKTMGYLVHLI